MVPVLVEKSNMKICCIHMQDQITLVFNSGPGANGLDSGTTRRTLLFLDPRLALKEGPDAPKVRKFRCNTSSTPMEKQLMVGWPQASENTPGQYGQTSLSKGLLPQNGAMHQEA
jgi:hypothetical protein